MTFNEYIDRIRTTVAISDLNAIVEEAANDDNLTTEEYRKIYDKAIENVQYGVIIWREKAAMTINYSECEIREGINSKLSEAIEDGQITMPEGILGDFVSDCVDTVIDWFEHDGNAHILTENDYNAVVLDMASIYDIINR